MRVYITYVSVCVCVLCKFNILSHLFSFEMNFTFDYRVCFNYCVLPQQVQVSNTVCIIVNNNRKKKQSISTESGSIAKA